MVRIAEIGEAVNMTMAKFFMILPSWRERIES